MTEDKILELQIAALASSELKKIDQMTVIPGAQGTANRLDIHRLAHQSSGNNQPKPVSTAGGQFLEAPKSEYAGSVQLDEPIYDNLELINVDEDTRLRASRRDITNGRLQPPATPEQSMQPPQQLPDQVTVGNVQALSSGPEMSEIYKKLDSMTEHINSLEKKVDKLSRSIRSVTTRNG